MTVSCFAPRLGACLARVAFAFTLLAGPAARAQTASSPWTAASVPSPTQYAGTSLVRATATDASGNVFVTGSYTGQVAFGNVLLPPAVGNDVFVAKYVPGTGTWAWVQTAGGIAGDQGNGLVVSGSSVYVTGYVSATNNDFYTLRFGGSGSTPGTVKQYGASSTGNPDLFVAKYTDNTTSATFQWCQVGGGNNSDQGNAVAVSGSTVYVTGYLTNSTTNTNAVLFGGSGTTAGTSPQYGASASSSQDVVLASYTDNGSTATFNWSQVGGGTGADQGQGVAVSGSSVYVTGYLTNNLLNTNAVLLGGSGTAPGTAPQYGAAGSTAGATSQDLLLARYTDNTSSANLAWSQVGGGSGTDQGTAVAATATGVYVTGYYTNSQADASLVRLGGSGATPGTTVLKGASATTSQDLLLARYTDNASSAALAWTQVGGGTASDQGTAVAVSGSSVYVTGTYTNTTADGFSVRFGGDGGSTAGTTPLPALLDTFGSTVLVARYADAGTLGWVLGSGNLNSGYSQGLAVSGSSLYVGGYLSSSARFTFGTASVAALAGTYNNRLLLGQVGDGGSSGSWQAIASTGIGGTSQARAVAADASGNLFATGTFSGTVVVGGTTLVSAGGQDLYVAKYVPGTDTWAWAQSGGGYSDDFGQGVAVRGSSVYVTGVIVNNTSNVSSVGFGGSSPATSTATVRGASTGNGQDLLLAKYTDNGSTGTLTWTQVAGGSLGDQGSAVAVGGTNLVYVTGAINNNGADSYAVRFGGNGTTAGTSPQAGVASGASQDLVLARYTDNGASATFNWSQVGGGGNTDLGQGVAVNGSSVYVTGSITNTTANATSVLFGGSGTAPGTSPQYGASTVLNPDLVLAKYTDNGAANTGTFNWSQVAGGTGTDQGNAVAVGGTNLVYVTGFITNSTSNANTVLFGGSGTVAGTAPQYGANSSASQDLVLAKYTDNGADATLGWTQVGGGLYSDAGYALAVSGASVYVGGAITNTSSNSSNVVFGGSGTTAGGLPVRGASGGNSNDVLLARYSDYGPSAGLRLVQTGGYYGTDTGYGVALRGSTAYVAGGTTGGGLFGSYTTGGPANSATSVIASLADNAPLPVQLVAFTAQAAGPAAVQLAWTTASEVNSAAFEVQRSPDGLAWTMLGRVAAAGNSASARTYAYRDEAAPTGTSYYRLRQLDLDGSSAYSPVRTVMLGAGGLSVYPNPAPGAALLNGATPGATVRVLDALGRLAATAAVGADGTARLAGLAPGLYLLRCGNGSLRLAVE